MKEAFAFVLFLVPVTMGQPTRNVSKIVGGTDASPGEFPYQVSFQSISGSFTFHFCGGSIYDERHVITAAHCVAGRNASEPVDLQVVAGDLDLDLHEGTEQVKKVVKIIEHENYDPSRLVNDIAVLQIEGRFTFDDWVQPIKLPAQGRSTTGECVVTGWGTTREGGSPSHVLQKVFVPVISDEKCRQSYSEERISDSMICGGYVEGGKDSCQGDSGGPMKCDGYLAGIVSWGIGCARPNYPGVYTETAFYVDWIVKNAV